MKIHALKGDDRMKLMLHYLKKHIGLCVLDVIGVLGFVLTELGLPTLMAHLIDNGILKQNKTTIWQIGILMIIVTLVGVGLSMMLSVVCAKITTRIVREIRDDLYAQIQTYSHAEYEQIGVSSLITRLTNDAYQIMMFLNTVLRMGVTAPLMFIASMLIIYQTSPTLSKYVFITLPFLIAGVLLISFLSKPISERQQGNLDQINCSLRENLSGIRVIRAFRRESFEEERFEKTNADYRNSSQKLFLLMATSNPAFNLLFGFLLAFILWVGARLINAGTLPIGNYAAIIEYIFHALYSTMLFATIFMMYPRANVSANRIMEAMKLESQLANDGKIQPDQLDSLTMDQVSFTYPGDDKPVLENVSLTAHVGETVAFIGSTGSGKSSLMQLLPRLYDASSGSISYGNHPIQDYDLDALRKQMGYIPQKATLFEGTIADNLRYGKPDATEEEMWEALRIAQAEDFVREKEKGLLEPVSEGGSNFSGGQKQRLAIARALIRKPQIYLFDDSFSALDYQTDAALRKALKPEVQQAMVFIVAQRVSTIMDADCIVVLDKGSVVGMGTHQDLLQHNAIYREIAESQLKEEELENA